MSESRYLYRSRITKVTFNLSGSETARADSYVPITSYDLVRNNKPFPGGLYDAHMGPADHATRCETCYNKHDCIGHEGHYHLRYPVYNPLGVNDARKWLKLICFECGHPIIDESKFMSIPMNRRLDEASKLARNGDRICVHCKTIHPLIKKDTKEPLALTREMREGEKQTDKTFLYPHESAEILTRISDATLLKFRKSTLSHPRNYLLRDIKVPSVVIRPDVKKIGGGRSTNDDLTTALQVVIKKDETMPSVIPAIIDPKLQSSIWELNNAYYNFVKADGDNAMNSLAKRLKGKKGRFRKNQLGKRVRNMIRSTIVGDPSIHIDEVGIPLTFARTIQLEETVQEYNKKRLLSYIQNGRKKYPGATKIIKKNTGVEYDVDAPRDIELENGDIVMRDMLDGDHVGFNRQPSLALSNIGTHRAKIILDPQVRTLLMNVLATPLYNADFDGDQMNVIVYLAVAARNEVGQLSAVANWFISHTNSSPSMGQVDDSIIGTAELTRSGVMFDKYHAMLLFQNSTFMPRFGDVQLLSGRECMSKLLVETPINFSRGTTWYKPDMAPWIKYDPTEISVKIDQGNLLHGVLDKSSISKGGNGNIYHIIANEYGNDRALDTIFNMQQMAISYIYQRGYTIGIMDMLVSAAAKAEIDRRSADTINKSRLITEKLHNGEIIPPIDKTVEEFFEDEQIGILRVIDNYIEPILDSIDPQTNNLFKLIAFGSKGNTSHMFNMVSAIGQKLINGERIRQKFGFKRTLAYYPRFDTSPEARGYITNSYLAGMTSSEYVFNAMAARFDLISKALSTSVTGEQNRTSIKNLESIIINNFRWAVKNRNIIELAYGEDYLDPRKVERVEFPTVLVSDAAFEAAYVHDDFPELAATMRNDRQLYRKIFLTVERMNVKELMTNERRMPVNVGRIIQDILRDNIDSLSMPDSETLAKMTSMVKTACDKLPYILINEIQERRESDIPEHIVCASWLLSMLVRSHLHPRALIALKMTPTILSIIIDKIRLRYSQALVDPGTAAGIIAAQSFSEPLTQYMLDAHHRSSTGGTSKSGMTRVKEVLSAKADDKLSNPSMLIPVLREYENDPAKVQEIANNIEMMKVRQFVSLWQIFFEKFGEPIHTKYSHESAMIADFVKSNPLLTPPVDLVKWCIRLVLNRTTLILKNMSLDLIVTKIRELFPHLYVVYTPENSKQIILRIYMRNEIFKGPVTAGEIKTIKDNILETIIRGVNGITSARVMKLVRNKVNEDGSISKNDNIWGIVTMGTNMRGIMANKYVDRYNVITDAIQETARMFGIEAGRQRVVSEIRNQVESCNHRHYLIYADEMCYTGKVTSIQSAGLKTRESSNVLLRVGFSSPLVTLEEAAINAMEDEVTGVTSSLLIGTVPKIGTLYNKFYMNERFIHENVKRPDEIIESIFD